MQSLTKKYRPKYLIRGDKVDLDKDKWYVAVPDKYADKRINVVYGDTAMLIEDWKKQALMFRRFRDKFWVQGSNRSQYYTLGYFEFKPDIKEKGKK